MKWKLFILGISLMGVGVLVHYLWGYKDGMLIEGAFALPLIFGWLCLLMLLAMHHPARTTPGNSRPAMGRKILYTTYFINYLLWLVALVCLFLFADHLLEQRVAAILRNDSVVGYATATVTAVEGRTNKTGTKYFAIIEYPTPAGKVQQAIREEEGTYTSGQRMKVKYAQQYPDMFVMVDAFIRMDR